MSIIRRSEVYKNVEPADDTVIEVSVEFHYAGVKSTKPSMVYNITPERVFPAVIENVHFDRHIKMLKRSYKDLLVQIN